MVTEFTATKAARCVECRHQHIAGSRVFVCWLTYRMWCGWSCWLRWAEKQPAS